MSPHIRDRILRHLDSLADEKGYQVLDYLEFLGSKYAERQAPSPSIFTRFAEGVEDTMRAGRISTTAISETMGFMNKAMGVLNGVAAAGKSVATDIVSAASSVTKPSDAAPIDASAPDARPDSTAGTDGPAESK